MDGMFLGAGVKPGDITAETSGERCRARPLPCAAQDCLKRARTSQFAAGKNTPCDLGHVSLGQLKVAPTIESCCTAALAQAPSPGLGALVLVR